MFEKCRRSSFIKEYINKTRWCYSEAIKDFHIREVCDDAEYAWSIINK